MNADMEGVTMTSACQARDTLEGTNTLREMRLRGKLNIRGNPGNLDFITKVEEVLDMKLPLSPNSYLEHEELRLFWLGPDEWLLHCDLEDTGTIQDRLTRTLAGIHHAVTEVSDYFTILRLRGPDAVALLQRGCPLDLHHEGFPTGNIAQTRFGHASVLLLNHDDGETWDIQVRWSYAEYVWDYLVSAMKALPSRPDPAPAADADDY